MKLSVPLSLLSFSALVLAQAAEETTEVSGDVAASEGSAEDLTSETVVETTTLGSSYEDEEATTTLTETVLSTEAADETSTITDASAAGNHTVPGVLDQSENGANAKFDIAHGISFGLSIVIGALLI